MKLPLLAIDDRHELLALHRALFEAKLHPDPIDSDIAASPILARLADRVIESLVKAELAEGKSDSQERWHAWRQAAKHPDRIDAVRSAIARESKWTGLTMEAKRRFVADALSPLVAEADLLDDLISDAKGQ